MVHNERDQTNALASAAVSAQRTLVELGFSSSYGKLQGLAVSCGRLLDGRSDLVDNNTVFNPPTDRYKSSGDRSAVVRLKIELIAIFRSVTHLRTNYRLAQLLANFRAKKMAIDSSEEEEAVKAKRLITPDRGGSFFRGSFSSTHHEPVSDASNHRGMLFSCERLRGCISTSTLSVAFTGKSACL